MRNNLRVLLFFCGYSLFAFNGYSQSETYQTFIGIWKNSADEVTLELRNDNSGSYTLGTKTFQFQEPYTFRNSSGSELNLEFQIEIKGTKKMVYAFVKELSSTQIKFLGFLSKEELQTADDAIKDSGITLT